MNVIPVINCEDLACVREKIKIAQTFLEPEAMLHLDVTDGVFSPHRTWHDAKEWAALQAPFALETHLMVRHPGIYIEEWRSVGMKRCIVHVESMNPALADEICDSAKQNGISVLLSSNPETPAAELEPYLARFDGFQVLAVHPGASGQEFMNSSLAKIRFLREHAPHATIEVDGGMNLETAEAAKSAGADTIVSEHYIFENEKPKEAYQRLKNI